MACWPASNLWWGSPLTELRHRTPPISENLLPPWQCHLALGGVQGWAVWASRGSSWELETLSLWAQL